jgi:hypothetical protein
VPVHMLCLYICCACTYVVPVHMLCPYIICCARTSYVVPVHHMLCLYIIRCACTSPSTIRYCCNDLLMQFSIITTRLTIIIVFSHHIIKHNVDESLQILTIRILNIVDVLLYCCYENTLCEFFLHVCCTSLFSTTC